MFVLEFFSWWYGRGWKQTIDNLAPRIAAIANGFSLTQLIKTLFEPWRRIISYPGASLGERFRAWGDNAFSRVVGFVVRLFVILAALLVIVLTGLLSIIEIVIWPLLPLAVPVLIVAGLAA